MNNLDILLRERIELEDRIRQINDQARSSAISEAKKIIAQFDLGPYDLFDEITIKVRPKFMNPDTGELWSGRGKTPKWLIGKDRNKYMID